MELVESWTIDEEEAETVTGDLDCVVDASQGVTG
jgi:hypothetical protein